MKILIVGGSGGIGLSIVNKFIENYPGTQITATYYKHLPELKHTRLSWVQLDVTNEEQIKNLADDLASIDILINAVGILHTANHSPEKSIKQFDMDFYNFNISLNTLPSILLAKYFMSSLRSKHDTYFIVFSAKIGSIADNRLGGWISYRSSKAATKIKK